MSSQYIFTMHQLSRRFPPDKTVLENVSLSFFPGAKIGVLGYNGAGKSTVLRIMAGQDHDYTGEAKLAPNATVGMLEQEPHLDEAKDVRGNVEDGVAEVRDLMARFNELSMNYSDETADEFARLQDQIDAADGWNLDTMIDTAMDALRLPPADAADHEPLRRREAPRRAVPAAALGARPAAAGRADQPPRRGVGRLAGDPPRRLQGRDRRGHPRSLLPRQRRAVDPRDRPLARHPLRGQLLRLARSRSRSASRWRRRRSPPGRAPSRPSSSGCARTRRAVASRTRRASPATRSSSPRTATSSSTRSRSTSRPASVWATR